MSGADRLEVVVHAMSVAADRALLLELRPAEAGGALPPFPPGAHVDVRLDRPDGGTVIRQYSLVGDGGDAEAPPASYLVCVRHEPAGRGGSAAVHERLRVGDRIAVSPPRSAFALPQDADRVLLLGGGVGVTPLTAMAERLHRDGVQFVLHAYAANDRSLPLAEWMRARAWGDRLVIHRSDDGDSFRDAAPPGLAAPSPSAAVAICGPPGFIAAARDRAAAAGWPAERVVVERFVVDEPVITSGAAFTVVAASTGQAMPVGERETIAEVLQRHGYEVFLSCEQGICGSCITPVVAGIPDHRDEVQSAEEHAANSQINVCCSRSSSPVLELGI